MNTSMIVYRLFDVADEINLDLVQALWTSRNKIASRLRLDRISTKSITFKNPPVLVELGNHDLEINGKTYFTEVKARIFDIGVISLILRIEFEEDVTEAEYLDMAIASENMPEDKIREYLDSVLETIEQACTKKRVSDFEEDFVVYYFKDEMPKWKRMATGMKRQYFFSSCRMVPSSRNSLQSSAMCSTMSVPRSVCFLSSSIVNSGLPSQLQCWAGSSFHDLVKISTLSLTMKAL